MQDKSRRNPRFFGIGLAVRFRPIDTDRTPWAGTARMLLVAVAASAC